MAEKQCKNCERLSQAIEDLEEQVFNLTACLLEIAEKATEIRNIAEFSP